MVETLKVPTTTAPPRTPSMAERGEALNSVFNPTILQDERRRNGQYAAVAVVLVVLVVALYHACMQQNAMLAGFLVPGLIMLIYVLWVLHSAARARAKHMHFARVIAAAAAVSSSRSRSASPRPHRHHGPGLAVPMSPSKEPSPTRELCTCMQQGCRDPKCTSNLCNDRSKSFSCSREFKY